MPTAFGLGIRAMHGFKHLAGWACWVFVSRGRCLLILLDDGTTHRRDQGVDYVLGVVCFSLSPMPRRMAEVMVVLDSSWVSGFQNLKAIVEMQV